MRESFLPPCLDDAAAGWEPVVETGLRIGSLRDVRRLETCPVDAVATAAALPGTHRAIILHVRGLALGEPAALEVWALAQLTGRAEAAVLRDAETLAGRRLVSVRRGEDPAVALTDRGREVAALLHHWRQI